MNRAGASSATQAAAPPSPWARCAAAPGRAGRRSPAGDQRRSPREQGVEQRGHGASARARDIASSRLARQSQRIDGQGRVQSLEERRGGGGEYQRIQRSGAAPRGLHRESEGVLVPTANRSITVAAAGQTGELERARRGGAIEPQQWRIDADSRNASHLFLCSQALAPVCRFQP